jgi:hypothetical protein
LTDGRTSDFVQSAVWADDIKEPGMNFWDNWHFFDKPYNEHGLYIMLDPVQKT